MTSWRVIDGDCRDILGTLPAQSVHCCITSPPYFGLRDYGTGDWEGGDAACDHRGQRRVSDRSALHTNRSHAIYPDEKATQHYTPMRDECTACGARRVDRQIGLEKSPDEFVAALVEAFDEVWRVLRDDGTAWLNLGDSMSVGANLLDELERLMKGAPVLCRDGSTVRSPAERVDVSLKDDGSPDGELLGLLGVERITLKKRNDYLGQVVHLLGGPAYARVTVPIAAVTRHAADLEVILDVLDDVQVVVTDLDADGHSVLGITRVGGRSSREEADASLAVEEAGEPVAERLRHLESTRDSVALDAAGERIPDVYAIDQAIPLGEAANATARGGGDFGVASASEKHLALTVGDRGWRFAFPRVADLFIPDGFGGFRPYTEVYREATGNFNELRAKQELSIPDAVKRALKRRGWICRSTIIWSKPNPMPESVRSRPTKAHETVFLLSKRAIYHYDAEAIREDGKPESAARYDYAFGAGPKAATALDVSDNGLDRRTVPIGEREFDGRRNKRSVWTVATQPYAGAHFATFPPKLVEPMILAGCPERCCAECGAPWERVVESAGDVREARDGAATKAARVGPTGGARVLDANGWNLPTKDRRTVGFAPSCSCDNGTTAGTILDPFAGAGTTGVVALRHNRSFIGVELSPEYAEMARWRIRDDAPLLNGHSEAA